jgi:Right handed beta helix region
MKTNNLIPSPVIIIIFYFLLISAFFGSCKKEANSVGAKISNIDDSKSATGFIDTGSNIIGATVISGMANGVVANNAFKPAATVILSNQHDIVIQGVAISNITLYNCYNITIKNCKIGPYKQIGIILSQCNNVHIDSCYLYQVSTGVYANDSKTISVTNCQAKNMMGPFPDGQFVQYKNVSGGGNRVSFNKFQNILGESYTEDAISMYASNGLPADPIVIEGNWIRGGGPSHSGGGIMLGDGGGSNMVAKNNILVDPGQYGMAVSGGSYMSIINNTIFGKTQAFTGVGIYYRSYFGPTSGNIYVGKNAVNYTNSKNVLSNTYLGPEDSAPGGWITNIYRAELSGSILPETIVSGSIFVSH